jgi:double zinc ribbon protein
MLLRGLLVSLSRHGVLECLACGHENKAGDKFCAQCASSLDLKLCSVCEAINANSDACYKCGADLRGEPQAPVSVQDQSLPANRLSNRTSRVFALSTSKRLAVLFVVPIVLLAGTVALFNGGTLSSDTGPTSTALAPAPEDRTEGWGLVQSSHSDDDTAMTVKVMSVSVAHETPSAVVMERAVSSVTHTKAAPLATAVALPMTQTPAAAAPAALAPEPSREKLAAPASMVAAPSYSRVTHTKAQQPARKPRSGSATFAAAVSVPAEQSVDSREEKPAGCAPGVAALGLCINK